MPHLLSQMLKRHTEARARTRKTSSDWYLTIYDVENSIQDLAVVTGAQLKTCFKTLRINIIFP